MGGTRGRDKATVGNMGRETPMLCLAEAEAGAEAERRREHAPVRRKEEGGFSEFPGERGE